MDSRLRKELEAILRIKGVGLTIEELAEDFEKAGRLVPCANFSAIPPPQCKLGYDLDCLYCSDYQSHEPPGSLESAICEYEQGKVHHIMRYAESDGFYRQGETFCGRYVDERDDEVEIYNDDSFSDRRICRRCETEQKKIKDKHKTRQ